MKRIYKRYEDWECYKAGFFNNVLPKEKQHHIDKVVELFSSAELTKKYMDTVIELWPNSCDHNLTNESMNKIAWLGQSACCIFSKTPSTITMEAWRYVS